MSPPAAGAERAKGHGWVPRIAFPFQRSMFTQSIGISGVGAVLGLDDEAPDLTIHLSAETSTTWTDCSKNTACSPPDRLLFWCPGRFGRQSTGPSKDLQALPASSFAKDLPWLSRYETRRKAMPANRRRRARDDRSLRQNHPQIWRALIQRAEVAVTNDSGSMPCRRIPRANRWSACSGPRIPSTSGRTNVRTRLCGWTFRAHPAITGG